MKPLTRKFIRWLLNAEILSFPRKVFAKIVIYVIQSVRAEVIFCTDPRPKRVIDLINKIKQETQMELMDSEAYQIFMAIKRTEKIKGDIAEVGVYKGGSAKLICEAKRDKLLYLFDTFEGIPEVDEIDTPRLYKSRFADTSFKNVRTYLRRYKNVYFYKGIFPATAKHIKNKRFSFVHLDVDTYKSSLDCLKFFYPRMSKGGIIMSHDYISLAGIRKAFDGFFKNKPEPIIEMSGNQCLIVKTN